LPADTALIREALTSGNPGAVVTALLVFHAPRGAEIRALTLTDVDTAAGTVTVGERPMAGARVQAPGRMHRPAGTGCVR
jgi:hypothetical protein